MHYNFYWIAQIYELIVNNLFMYKKNLWLISFV